MPEWKQERPTWCPHVDCSFRARSQDSLCIGELPEPQAHGDHEGVNTHRFCQRGAPDDGEWLHTIEWNRGDAWHLRRCIDAVFFPDRDESRETIHDDMLAALKALDRMTRGLDWCDADEQSRRWSEARAAIAKATGEDTP
jgi:hypothetical protein